MSDIMAEINKERREHAEMVVQDSRVEVCTTDENDPSQIVFRGYIGNGILLQDKDDVEIALHVVKALNYYYCEVKRLEKVINNLKKEKAND